MLVELMMHIILLNIKKCRYLALKASADRFNAFVYKVDVDDVK